ncbi:molybdenum ABC transporter substrate-binding protein [Pontibacillus halophilus JSM 076056 = DSM 19796]|uniref:Molybdenum ABC transporter substrate-binding protein n=1 Tax=Pontibacillus halophilus JSM 076056 = DSM 19796 TaxID=1385510 RepID=A0A0A5I9S1_9BACI|nr:molybdate ABC transporter substrate-binding protein [Pontibacillus halophilus]KGX92567.1 molybdenum ABC transporter substrate-binding protein [Pontibacillus halophilus JSM 076056 = DSM 19796]
MYKTISFLLIFLLVGCQTEEEERTLRISVASSLTNVMEEVEQAYEQEHPSIDLLINYGSSGTLAHQIDRGAPADVFLPASTEWMEFVMEKGLIDESTYHELAYNELVVASKEGESYNFQDLLDKKVDSFAMGEPESVPAGTYAKEALGEQWETVQDKAVFAKNVRQVASYIKTGNVDAGFVYRSDVMTLEGLTSLSVVPKERYSQIVYPGAVVALSERSEEAEAFLAYLRSKESQEIFHAHGFKEGG